jgi:hypothetical protein
VVVPLVMDAQMRAEREGLMGGLRPRTVVVIIVVLVAIFAPAVLTTAFDALVKVTGDTLRDAMSQAGR